MIEVLLWAPDRQTFITTMAALLYPNTQEPLASVAADSGALVPHADVLIDEIGPVTKTPAVLDGEGNVVTPAVVVDGWHVNLVATGALAGLLTDGLAQTDGDGAPLGLFTRTRILSFLGSMTQEAATAAGVPAGLVGTSGVRVFDSAEIGHRARVWQ